MTEKLITVLLSGLLTFASSVGMDKRSTEIPFELHKHLVVVRGSIGSLHGLNFVIDTGASLTVISRKVARKLNLSGEPQIVTAYGKKQKVQRVELQELRIEDLTFQRVSAQIAKLSFSGMDRPLRIDGLIGLDLLRRSSVSIDYERKRLVFGQVEHAAVGFPFYNKLPIILVPLTIGGKRLSLLLDTGAEGIILYQFRVEGKIPMKRNHERKSIPCLGRKVDLRKFYLSHVSSGDTQWDDLPVYLIEGSVSRSDPDGVLGVSVLGLKRLNLDFQNNRISWEKQ